MKPETAWQRMVFTERNDLKAVIKMYPTVKGPIEEAQRNESRITTTPQALQVQTAAARSGNVVLLFLFIQDALLCGSHGCDLTVYVDEGSGYKKAVSMVAFPIVYLSTGESPVSLLFCGSLQGGGKWNPKNNALVFVGLRLPRDYSALVSWPTSQGTSALLRAHREMTTRAKFALRAVTETLLRHGLGRRKRRWGTS